jgi:hypothetical protein
MKRPRPQLTAIQKEGAGFALAELRRLYVARLDYMAIALGFVEIMDCYSLRMPLASALPGWTDSPANLAEAIDELAGFIERAEIIKPEFSTVLSVQTGDAGEGAAALSPAEPLKAAA